MGNVHRRYATVNGHPTFYRQAGTERGYPNLYGWLTESFGNLVADQMRRVAKEVERSEVFDRCGHSLTLEAEHRRADTLRECMVRCDH